MNIEPNALRILCYGDSNTWGRVPAKEGHRYPIDVRWTGLLQKTLGDSYEVIEEGLGGRTTVIDDDKRLGRNGKTFLPLLLESHKPVDIVIVMLGTNDLKERYQRTPEQITQGMEELLLIIKNEGKNRDGDSPEIIFMSPPLVDETVLGVERNYKGAEIKSRQLGVLYKQLANKYGLELIDLAMLVRPSKADGYHLESESHARIAEVLVKKIKNISI